MQRHSICCAGALCGLVLVVAAAGPARAHPADPCHDLVSWGLYVGGLPAEPLVAFLREPANHALAEALIFNSPEDRVVIPAGSLRIDERELPVEDLAIGGLGIDVELSDLVDLLTAIDRDPREVPPEVPEALRGLAGLSTTLFLQKLLPLADPAEQPPIADKVLRGRIRDFTFVEATGRGHLSVDTCTDVREFVPLGDDRREFIHWDVEVLEGGFEVFPRADPSDINDPSTYFEPFPGNSEAIPVAAADPSNPRSVWRRGLDHKLHAKPGGIEIAHIHYRRLSEPDLVRLDDDHHWYEVDDKSCVNILTVGPPAGTFGELVSRNYCLGRCVHPPIINSGE